MYSVYGYAALPAQGFPIRKSADQWLFAPPRSLSQLVASFFGSRCQGIPLVLLSAWTSFVPSLALLLYCMLIANRLKCFHSVLIVICPSLSLRAYLFHGKTFNIFYQKSSCFCRIRFPYTFRFAFSYSFFNVLSFGPLPEIR